MIFLYWYYQREHLEEQHSENNHALFLCYLMVRAWGYRSGERKPSSFSSQIEKITDIWRFPHPLQISKAHGQIPYLHHMDRNPFLWWRLHRSNLSSNTSAPLPIQCAIWPWKPIHQSPSFLWRGQVYHRYSYSVAHHYNVRSTESTLNVFIMVHSHMHTNLAASPITYLKRAFSLEYLSHQHSK